MNKETKVKKLAINLGEIVFDNVIYGCPLCNKQVDIDSNFCSECGIEFLDKYKEE